MKQDSAGCSIPRYVVCPRCHAPLLSSEGGVRCTSCSTVYPRHATVHFADVADDVEKARQQAIYDGDMPDTALELPYRDLEQYQDYCARITDLIHRQGLNGHQLKALKTRTILDRLRPQPGDRVLDVGSGTGSTLALLTLRYGTIGTGIDISPMAVERGARANPWGHEYYQADAEQLPFLDDTFDGVISFDVLEHLPRPNKCIAEAARVLRPGGWALFYAVSQADTYTWHWVQRCLTRGRAGVDCGAGHRWENFLRPDQARAWMKESSLVEIRVTPFHALATLIWDERFASITARLVRFPRLLRTLLSVAELIDLPVTSKGLGNGFYVEGHKAAKADQ